MKSYVNWFITVVFDSFLSHFSTSHQQIMG